MASWSSVGLEKKIIRNRLGIYLDGRAHMTGQWIISGGEESIKLLNLLM